MRLPNWVEEVVEADTVRFGDEAEQRAIPVKTPGPALLDHFDASLIVAAVAATSQCTFVHQCRPISRDCCHKIVTT